jgi:type II secretory pathway component GspD/PulD (secretin)
MKLGEDISEISETGTLIVTSYAYRMARIEEILQMVDKPGEPKQFRFRQLRYTMAATLAPKIKTLAEQIGTVSIDIAAPVAAPQAAPPRRRVPTRRAPRVEPTPPRAAEAAVYLDADERTNRILMIGYKNELDMVDDLIGALDVEQQDLRTLRLYEIQHVGAEEVRNKLAELGIIGGGVSAGRVPGGAKAPAPAAPQPAGVAGEPLVEEPQVVIIESTNSLLVNATDEQHIQIATIISYVDSETMMQAIPYVIYPLENQKPGDMAAVLQQLIQETIKDQEGKIQTVVKRTEEEIVIVPDDNTFSLIVYASKKNQEWISNLIKTLDKRRPQVLIDVTLVEVSRTDLFDLDLQLASKFPVLKAGEEMDVVGSVISPFLSKRSTEAYSSPKTETSQGFYSDRHIQALLTAMQNKSYGRVLAKPKILVNDGQAGTIKTTDKTNVKFEDFISGGTDKPDRTVVRYEPYSAGITLTITPNISEGDLLLLETKLTRSDFGKRVGEAPPDTTESDIETTVTVPDGRTIILGGMVKLNQSKGGTKVPLIGDVPIIGGLFRSTGNEDRESKLYIFVKANILRPNEAVAGLPELEKISDRNRMAFEDFEEQFQQHEDWPGIKPKPMHPLNILEAE